MPFNAGDKLRASDLDDMEDDIAALQTDGVWSSYTPTWTAASGTNPTIGNGTLAARWCKVGKLVHVRLRLVIGSTTGLGTGDWLFSLPLASVANENLETFGSCVSLAGAYRHDVITIASGASTLRMIGMAAGAFYRNTVPAAWTTGNFLNLSFTYEAA